METKVGLCIEGNVMLQLHEAYNTDTINCLVTRAPLPYQNYNLAVQSFKNPNIRVVLVSYNDSNIKINTTPNLRLTINSTINKILHNKQ